MGHFSRFGGGIGRFIKARYRLLVACLFLLMVAIFFMVAVKKDLKSKEWQQVLGMGDLGLNSYSLTFTSIDRNNQTVNGTLNLKEAGLRSPELLNSKILYGELAYADLTYLYAMWPKESADAITSVRPETSVLTRSLLVPPG